MIGRALLMAAATAVLLPAVAIAQNYYQPRDYGSSRGDYDDDRGFRGYPEFQGIENHIRSEINEGLRDDLIERDDARDLFGQLRDIQRREAREFRAHGWDLPRDDRYEIRSRLDELDHRVDEIRDEPEG